MKIALERTNQESNNSAENTFETSGAKGSIKKEPKDMTEEEFDKFDEELKSNYQKSIR